MASSAKSVGFRAGPGLRRELEQLARRLSRPGAAVTIAEAGTTIEGVVVVRDCSTKNPSTAAAATLHLFRCTSCHRHLLPLLLKNALQKLYCLDYVGGVSRPFAIVRCTRARSCSNSRPNAPRSVK